MSWGENEENTFRRGLLEIGGSNYEETFSFPTLGKVDTSTWPNFDILLHICVM
jgi:hypothetical protein